jgi:transposase-like protein
MKDPQTLAEAITFFSDSENCRQFMISIRWPDGIVRCPRCGHDKVAYLEKAKLYFCPQKHPKQKFSLKVGTIYEDSAISLEKWLPASWLIANCRNGISSYEIARAIGVTQKSAWFMLHRIREAMRDTSTNQFGFGGPVESDEAFIGPNPQKMHKSRKAKVQARDGFKGGYVGKTAVHGILDRELRQVRAKVLPNIKRETLQNEILKNVTPLAEVYTDEAGCYDDLQRDYIHKIVNHSREYVRGNVHTNGIENLWSLLKRTLRGTYVAVEPFHLDRYVAEQVFRFNHRKDDLGNNLTDFQRFATVISEIVGKRLTYAELTGKEPEREVF